MGARSDLLETCGFFKKYEKTKDLARRGFIRQHCKGPDMHDRWRKAYRKAHGPAPQDDMMPYGSLLAGAGRIG